MLFLKGAAIRLAFYFAIMISRIGVFSFLLSFVAGFTDSTTFIAANRLFSAHVTGNFVVLAYDLVRGADRGEWSKLLAFPVFVLAALLAGSIDRHWKNSRRLLQLEGGLLLLAALAAACLRVGHSSAQLPLVGIEMTIVMAMAFQNVYVRLYPKNTFGPTTVMTGNVTSAALDIHPALFARPHNPEKRVSLGRNTAMIGVFLLGCLAGALLASRFGLAVVALPGLLVLASYHYE